MKKRIAIPLAALGGVVVIGFVAGGLANVIGPRTGRDEATILIQARDGQCAATTTVQGIDQGMQGKRNHRVHWQINDPGGCLPDNWEVELRFDGTVFWFTPNAKGRAEIRKLIQPFARVGPPPYQYKVWAVGDDQEYMMEDPELEIIQ
jgi:hypothetical protein